MCIGRRHGGGGGYTLVSRLESEKSMEYLNLLHLYGLDISLAGTNVPVHCHIDKDTYSIPFPT